jgi:hypothetical protein
MMFIISFSLGLLCATLIWMKFSQMKDDEIRLLKEDNKYLREKLHTPAPGAHHPAPSKPALTDADRRRIREEMKCIEEPNLEEL